MNIQFHLGIWLNIYTVMNVNSRSVTSCVPMRYAVPFPSDVLAKGFAETTKHRVFRRTVDAEETDG